MRPDPTYSLFNKDKGLRSYTLGGVNPPLSAQTNSWEGDFGMDNIHVRKITQKDIPQCLSILRELPKWFGIEQSILAYGTDLETLDGYVAVLKGELVGFVGLKRYGAYSIEINVIGVRPTSRGKGIGTTLLKQVEVKARTQEIKLLHVKTLAPSDPDPNYVETRAFWEAKGYIPMDSHLLWGPENPCQVMVKPLH